MHFKKGVRFACASIFLLSIARAMLKILDIDVQTGFYNRDNILGMVFNIAMFLVLGYLIVLSKKATHEDHTEPRIHRIQEMFAIFTGLSISICSAIRFYAGLSLDPNYIVNALPKSMQLGVHAIGVVAGGCLIASALWLMSGARATSAISVLALVPAVWQSVYMILTFMNFRFTVYSSDELFTTLYLALATLFFYYHAGIVAEVNPKPTAVVASGLSLAVCGIVISVGQIAALFVLGYLVAGPTLRECIVMLSVSFYAIAFCMCIADERGAKK